MSATVSPSTPLPRRPAAPGACQTSLRLLAAALLSWTSLGNAQTPGTLNPGYSPSSLPAGAVTASALQVDGKLVLAFSSTIARLNPDGSVDTGFNAPTGLSSVIYLVVGPYGKIVLLTKSSIPGDEGVVYQLLRLQADGTYDSNFPPVSFPGAPDSGEIHDFVLGVQVNGKIIVAGPFFDQSTGTSNVRIARYNTDGSVDPDFHFPSNMDAQNYDAVAPLPDGRILVAGFATDYATGSYHERFVFFLHADGTVDESYNADDVKTEAYASTLLPNGKIVYLARMTPPPGQSATSVLGGVPRLLNADGTADTSFAPQFETGASFTSLAVQADGKIVVGGYTANYSVPDSPNFSQSVLTSGVVRLNADGTTDANFNAGTGSNEGGTVDNVVVAPDGSVLITGNFNTFDGQRRDSIAELDGDGGLNLPFFDGEATLGNGVYYLALPDGKPFGYYAFLSDPHYVYHYDLGYEYIFPALDGASGLYLYDLKSGTFFYTSSSFPFPYLYDFTLNTVLYYYPDPSNAGHYNTKGMRYFYDFATGKIISK